MTDPKDPLAAGMPPALRDALQKGTAPTPPQGAPGPQAQINVGYNADHVLIQFGENAEVITLSTEVAMSMANLLVSAVGKVKGKTLRLRIDGDN
jgi:hypothetical protein